MNFCCTEACNPIKEIKLCIQHSKTKDKLHTTATYRPTHHKPKQSKFLQLDEWEPYLKKIHFVAAVNKELYKFKLLYTITCAIMHTLLIFTRALKKFTFLNFADIKILYTDLPSNYRDKQDLLSLSFLSFSIYFWLYHCISQYKLITTN